MPRWRDPNPRLIPNPPSHSSPPPKPAANHLVPPPEPILDPSLLPASSSHLSGLISLLPPRSLPSVLPTTRKRGLPTDLSHRAPLFRLSSSSPHTGQRPAFAVATSCLEAPPQSSAGSALLDPRSSAQHPRSWEPEGARPSPPRHAAPFPLSTSVPCVCACQLSAHPRPGECPVSLTPAPPWCPARSRCSTNAE